MGDFIGINFFKRFARRQKPITQKALTKDLKSEFDALYNQHIRLNFRTVEIINNLDRLKRALATHKDLHVDRDTISKLDLLFECTTDSMLKRKIADVVLALAQNGDAGAIFLAKKLLVGNQNLEQEIKFVLETASNCRAITLKLREPIILEPIEEDKR